jgi:hypothetical protein
MRKPVYTLQRLILILLLLLSMRYSQGSEFVLMNRIISYDVNASDGFWLVMPDVTMPSNWFTPDNYYYGTIYSRYEIISAPTSVPCAIGWGFFQYKNPQQTELGELCELAPTLAGTGAVAYKTSSPSTWWRTDGGVDFSKIADMQSMGVILYSKNPGDGNGWPVCRSNNGGDPGGITWNERFNWFPMTIRVTVVAVSNGSTFSGWDRYVIDPSRRQPKTAYGIDFINETTDRVVPSTDEFSIYSGMAYAVSGTGQRMPITPGQDHNFRTKAGSGLLASEVQHFRAPVRPGTPAFVLDKVNHRTTTGVSGEYEYSDNPDFTGAVTGTGSQVNIPAGTTMYFRKKATAIAFRSTVQALNESSELPIAHELLLINDTIEWPNATDTNGFYYFYYNADMPANWITPDDYHYGEIFARYEIISEKTEETVGLQTGFWQMLPPETGELHETMSPMAVMNGTGSVVTVRSSPYQWWKLTSGFDYTQMDRTWHLGINPWKVDPTDNSRLQIRQENSSVWAERNSKWFPMKVYVTIVAVAAYREFSGWQHYVNYSAKRKRAMPSIGIDYINEQTNLVIPDSVEYAYDAGMSGARNGSGQRLALTPGNDVYFRTRAGIGNYASDILHLVVPANPPAPAVTINYAGETTAVLTPGTEWSVNADMSGAVSGTNTAIQVTPGTHRYFRNKATASAFRSGIQDLYIPVRPAAPEISINFAGNSTAVIPSTMEWAFNATMIPAARGQGITVPVTPSVDMYFRSVATASAFRSEIQHLVVPALPATPAYGINFVQQTTNIPVSANDEYAFSADMSGAVAGSNTAVNVTPGIDMYFRRKASATAFRSLIQTLDVPAKPASPAFTINYTDGTTNEAAGTDIAFSGYADMAGQVFGTGVPVTLQPGHDLYFKQVAGSTSFTSDISFLAVPFCNFLGYSGADTVTSSKFTLYAILTDQSHVLTLADIQVTNGTAQNLRAGNVFDVYPSVKGPVSVVIPANTIADNTFASNEVTVYYNVATGLAEYEKDNISIYPNPSDDGIIFIQTNQNRPYLIGIYSLDGHLMKTLEMPDGGTRQIDLSDFQKGMYFLKVSLQNNNRIHKIILN